MKKLLSGPVLAVFGLCLLAGQARADAIPKDIGLAKQALENLKIPEIWKLIGTTGIGAANLPAARKAKIQQLFLASFEKAIPALEDKVAAHEAASYSSAQLADIERISEVPSYQAVVMAGAKSEAEPDVNKMPKGDVDVIAELGGKDHVKKFTNEVLAQDIVMNVITSLSKKAVLKTQ